MRLLTRTSIRSERRVLLALGALSLVSLLVLGAVIGLGDQRRLRVAATDPGAGADVPATAGAIAVTFGANAERASVEQALAIEPPVEGGVRWRGKTIEFVPSGPLAPGAYVLRIGPGARGAAGEAFDGPFELRFTVREPGIAAVVREGGQERLVALRGATQVELARAERIRDFAIAPDGRSIAVVVVEGARTGLSLVDVESGGSRVLVDDEALDIGAVGWSAGSQGLLVTRRDRLPGGGESVPRTWLMRVSGEFVALIDPEGAPTQTAAWSPDEQSVAYVSPATATLVVWNLSTRERTVLGPPRGGAPGWSPDSRMVAFETIPVGGGGTVPAQPVAVRAIDGSIDRTFGTSGEIRSAPRFVDDMVVAMLRRELGEGSVGIELVFEDVGEGVSPGRRLSLGSRDENILDWDLHPAKDRGLFASEANGESRLVVVSFETGERTVVGVGERPRWLP